MSLRIMRSTTSSQVIRFLEKKRPKRLESKPPNKRTVIDETSSSTSTLTIDLLLPVLFVYGVQEFGLSTIKKGNKKKSLQEEIDVVKKELDTHKKPNG